MSALRVYADTSVFGGYFDAEFADSSRRFFDAVFNQSVTALISDTLVAELVAAPRDVQDLLAKTLQVGCERLQLTAEAITLRDAYLHANVVTAKYADDALHVAQATLARADVIVSWNFKHLVNPSRIRAFNGVNLGQGYGLVVIMTPPEVIGGLEQADG
jgi:predicted nucleic acid-binding protein